MEASRDLIEVVARAYEVDTPKASWLESIRQAAARAFGDGTWTSAQTFSVSADGTFSVCDIAADAHWEAAMRRAHARAHPSLIRQLYLHGPVQCLDRTLAAYPDDAGYKQYLRDGGHVTLSIGMDPSGNGCALALIRRDAVALDRSTRRALERLSAHLSSARRLRASLDEHQPAVDLLDKADAVLSADGSILHAEGEARDPESRRALCDAARRIDRARARRHPPSTLEALALWRALVEGRWSLIERFESDGRRIFVARRNDTPSRASHALDERENKLVALMALGHSIKLCAYELGRAESTVSEQARVALRKLGVRSRAELVEIHGAIVGDQG